MKRLDRLFIKRRGVQSFEDAFTCIFEVAKKQSSENTSFAWKTWKREEKKQNIRRRQDIRPKKEKEKKKEEKRKKNIHLSHSTFEWTRSAPFARVIRWINGSLGINVISSPGFERTRNIVKRAWLYDPRYLEIAQWIPAFTWHTRDTRVRKKKKEKKKNSTNRIVPPLTISTRWFERIRNSFALWIRPAVL